MAWKRQPGNHEPRSLQPLLGRPTRRCRTPAKVESRPFALYEKNLPSIGSRTMGRHISHQDGIAIRPTLAMPTPPPIHAAFDPSPQAKVIVVTVHGLPCRNAVCGADRAAAYCSPQISARSEQADAGIVHAMWPVSPKLTTLGSLPFMR